MSVRVQFGNTKKPLNAYSISQHGECLILQVGAFREEYTLGCLFYNAVLEHLRSAVPGMWMQIQSRNSLGGGRKKDLRLGIGEPLFTTEKYLVFDLKAKADLDAAFESFWQRKTLRFYGWQELPFSARIESIQILYPTEKLEDFSRFVPNLLRFCSEKDLWGGFLKVISAKSDFDLLKMAVQQASGLLSEPITEERSVFSESS